MANIIDYIKWRGDLTFEAAPFNEVDGLIFAWISYVRLKGIVPGRMNLWMPLWKAAEIFENVHDFEEEKKSVSFTKSASGLFLEMAKCPRYKDINLGFYREKYNSQNAMQFAAMTMQLSEDTLCIVYRGTDQTIVGWKEDFNMSYLEQVPSQDEALRYLMNVAEYWEGQIYTGGHSKGGNLAIYAAVNAPEQIDRQLAGIYNYDGPGFGENTLDVEEYQKLAQRIHTYVPQSSIVGMMLAHHEAYDIVRSEEKGIMQHDATSWQVLGDHFITLDSTTLTSQLTDATLTGWLETMDVQGRERFVDNMFSLLEATGARTLTELVGGGMKNLSTIVRALRDMPKEERTAIGAALMSLLRAGNDVLKQKVEAELPELLPFSGGTKE